MKGKDKFVFNKNKDTYTIQIKKRNYWWLLLLLLPFLLLILQIKIPKTILFKTVDKTNDIALADAKIKFTYPVRNFIDFSKFKFLTNTQEDATAVTGEDGRVKIKVKPTLYALLFHKTDLTTVVATGNCIQSDTLNPEYGELLTGKEYEIGLSTQKQKLNFLVIDSSDNQPLPNAEVDINYYVNGQKQTFTGRSAPNGVFVAEIVYCSEKIEIKASHYGYKNYEAGNTKDFYENAQNRNIPLEPIMTTVSFVVKDLYDQKTIPNAKVELLINNVSQNIVTNTNGIGKGAFDSVAISKTIQFNANHLSYYDTTTQTYTVEEYIDLPENQRVIYMRPKAGNFVFKNIDNLTKEALPGVKNVVFVNNKNIGEFYSNNLGEFVVPNLNKDDKISITSTKEDYIDNEETIRNKKISNLQSQKSRTIPLDPDFEPRNVKPPKENCRVHFSGTLLSDRYINNHISLIYSPDRYGEYVGEGEYPNNANAFPHAVDRTFDAIAVAKGTRVILYSKPNFQGKVLLDVTGPALINNVKWKNDARIGGFKTRNFKEPYESLFPKSCRRWSSENMNKWSKGSVKVICNK